MAALRLLASRDAPVSVLFVCLGNICRSPFAAARFRNALPAELADSMRITSAGFLGAGRRAPPSALAAAAPSEVDLSEHRSSVLTSELVRGADLVVVMDREQQRHICAAYGRHPEDVLILGDLDPVPIETRAIRDPYDQPPVVFEASYARIERCVLQLAGALGATPKSPHAGARHTTLRPVPPGTGRGGSEGSR